MGARTATRDARLRCSIPDTDGTDILASFAQLILRPFHPADAARPAEQVSDAGATALTIAIIPAADARRGAPAAASRLAELAVNDELLVVCGSSEQRSGSDAQAVTGGLRSLLPRHDVVALHVTPYVPAFRRDAALIGELLEIGSLPVVVTPAAAVREVVAQLFSYLRADRVLTVSCTTRRTDLRQVWPRRSPRSSWRHAAVDTTWAPGLSADRDPVGG
jgi:hypothetical protein